MESHCYQQRDLHTQYIYVTYSSYKICIYTLQMLYSDTYSSCRSLQYTKSKSKFKTIYQLLLLLILHIHIKLYIRDFRVFYLSSHSHNSMLKNIKYDLPAGLAVFLVAVPLCLGIAVASGAPLMSGLISG